MAPIVVDNLMTPSVCALASFAYVRMRRCGPKATIPVPVGWCMPVLPVATGLACAKVRATRLECQTSLAATTMLLPCYCTPLLLSPV